MGGMPLAWLVGVGVFAAVIYAGIHSCAGREYCGERGCLIGLINDLFPLLVIAMVACFAAGIFFPEPSLSGAELWGAFRSLLAGGN